MKDTRRIRFSQSKVMVYEIATRQLSNITKKKETWRGVCGEQKIATVSIDRARSADPVSNLGGPFGGKKMTRPC